MKLRKVFIILAILFCRPIDSSGQCKADLIVRAISNGEVYINTKNKIHVKIGDHISKKDLDSLSFTKATTKLLLYDECEISIQCISPKQENSNFIGKYEIVKYWTSLVFKRVVTATRDGNGSAHVEYQLNDTTPSEYRKKAVNIGILGSYQTFPIAVFGSNIEEAKDLRLRFPYKGDVIDYRIPIVDKQLTFDKNKIFISKGEPINLYETITTRLEYFDGNQYHLICLIKFDFEEDKDIINSIKDAFYKKE